VLLVVALPASGSQENSQSKQSTIRVSVDRVDVGVIVTDLRGQFVEGLHREDFRILDNGVEQPLTDFADVEQPAQVLLLIEAGPAVYLLESGHLQAAHTLLDGLSPNDRVAVAQYAEAPQALLPFTTEKQAAAEALDQVRFNLGFALLNLSSSVAKVLEWLGQVPGKKSIVLLSTGLDTSPPKEAASALQQLETDDVLLMAVSLTSGLGNPNPTGKKQKATPKSVQTSEQFAQANQVLKDMAESTGGRAYFPSNTNELKAAFAEIGRMARHEYSLAYAPPARDGQVHKIEVQVSGAGRHVNHRKAYLASAASAPQK
jgi:VWFA-related protein